MHLFDRHWFYESVDKRIVHFYYTPFIFFFDFQDRIKNIHSGINVISMTQMNKKQIWAMVEEISFFDLRIGGTKIINSLSELL